MPEDSSDKQPRLNESLVCDVCGHFGAVELGDRKLCPDCYESYGSCCPEFGREKCDEPVLTQPPSSTQSRPSGKLPS